MNGPDDASVSPLTVLHLTLSAIQCEYCERITLVFRDEVSMVAGCPFCLRPLTTTTGRVQ